MQNLKSWIVELESENKKSNLKLLESTTCKMHLEEIEMLKFNSQNLMDENRRLKHTTISTENKDPKLRDGEVTFTKLQNLETYNKCELHSKEIELFKMELQNLKLEKNMSRIPNKHKIKSNVKTKNKENHKNSKNHAFIYKYDYRNHKNLNIRSQEINGLNLKYQNRFYVRGQTRCYYPPENDNIIQKKTQRKKVPNKNGIENRNNHVNTDINGNVINSRTHNQKVNCYSSTNYYRTKKSNFRLCSYCYNYSYTSCGCRLGKRVTNPSIIWVPKQY